MGMEHDAAALHDAAEAVVGETVLFDNHIDGGRVATGVDGVDATDERRNATFPLFGVDAVASHDAASFRFRPP